MNSCSRLGVVVGLSADVELPVRQGQAVRVPLLNGDAGELDRIVARCQVIHNEVGVSLGHAPGHVVQRVEAPV